jgi:hypothetical protein
MKFARIGITAAAAITLSTGLAACSSDQQASTASGSATQVAMVNATCPFTGEANDPAVTTQYKGKTVGFCCEGCVGKWNKLSDAEKAEKLAGSM